MNEYRRRALAYRPLSAASHADIKQESARLGCDAISFCDAEEVPPPIRLESTDWEPLEGYPEAGLSDEQPDGQSGGGRPAVTGGAFSLAWKAEDNEKQMN